jgi:hypothetical protein
LNWASQKALHQQSSTPEKTPKNSDCGHTWVLKKQAVRMNPTNPKVLREEITRLEQRLAASRTREILLLEKLIALEAKFEKEVGKNEKA